MKLNANLLDQWLQKTYKPSCKIFLIYGPEEGGVILAQQNIIKFLASKSSEPQNITKFDYKSLKDNFNQILEEMGSLSLFGEKKVIVIEDVPNSIHKEFLEILTNTNLGTELILVASELKPTSNIRKLAESNDNAISIASYKDDPAQIQKFIRDYLLQNEIKFENDVPNLLSQLLPANRLIILAELDKLITYVIDKKFATTDDAINAVGDAAEVSFDDLCIAFALKDKKKLDREISKMKMEDVAFMLPIRVLQKYFYRILQVLSHMESGLNLEQAISKLSPPVFFKQKDNLIRVAKTIKKAQALEMIAKLQNLELNCKKVGINPELLVNEFVALGVA